MGSDSSACRSYSKPHTWQNLFDVHVDLRARGYNRFRTVEHGKYFESPLGRAPTTPARSRIGWKQSLPQHGVRP